MPETRSTGQEIQSEILDMLRKSQEAVVDAIKLWADAVQSITASIPTPNLPYSDKLPKPGGVRGQRLRLHRAAARLPPEVRRERARGNQAAASRQGGPGGHEGRH